VKIMSEKPNSMKSVNLTRGLRHHRYNFVALTGFWKQKR